MKPSDHLQNMLDACRPDHADWLEPELSDLSRAFECDPALAAQRAASEHFDRAVRDSLQDVPVPPQLANRLLASLGVTPSATADTFPADTQAMECSNSPVAAIAANSDSNTTIAEVTPATPDTAATSIATSVRRERRTWLAALSLATALSLLLGGWTWWSLAVRPPQSEELLAAEAQQWGEHLQASGPWRADAGRPSIVRPMSRQVRGEIVGWRILPTTHDRKAVAYALRGPLGDGWLVVLQTSAAFLRPDERPRRLATTGTWAVSAWNEGPLLFVLVTRDRPRHLDQFLVPQKLAGNMNGIHVSHAQSPKSVDDGGAA